MLFAMDNPKTRLDAISTAVRVLGEGGLVAFPTETVYGLGADATNSLAVAGIFAAKGRPSFNPLIAHCVSTEAAGEIAAFDAAAARLAAAFWPGPLTLVLPRALGSPIAELATAGLETVAVRVPAHPIAAELLKAFGKPIAAPSANRSGHVSPTRAEHVAADLGSAVQVILDGGPTEVGLESTIVAVGERGVSLLRPGGVSREAIEKVLGRKLVDAHGSEERPQAPGMLASHYAPAAKLRLDAHDVRPGEALLAFGPGLPAGAEGAVATINLSASRDLTEAAANLFEALRRLDASGRTIAVMPIPETGLGEAINDRLRRGAAPRDPA